MKVKNMDEVVNEVEDGNIRITTYRTEAGKFFHVCRIFYKDYDKQVWKRRSITILYHDLQDFLGLWRRICLFPYRSK